MSLTSRWIGDGEFILEVSDLSNTMGLSHPPVPNGYRFDSQRHTCIASREKSGWLYSSTRNYLRAGDHEVFWQMFYQMPHLGTVRKEVRWNRHELLRELRAAQVAMRLRPKATGTYSFPY